LITGNIAVRLLQQLILFAVALCIAKILEPQGNGAFSIFITDVSFFVIILGFCLESGVTYFTAGNKMQLKNVWSLAITLLLFQAIAFFALYFFVGAVFNYYFFTAGDTGSRLWWGFVYTFSLLLYNYANAYLNGKGSFFKQVAGFVVVQLLYLTVLVILYAANLLPLSFFVANSIPLFCGLAVIQLIVTVIVLLVQKQEVLQWVHPFKQLPPAFFVYSITVFIGNLLQFFAYRADVWILHHYHGDEAVGLYALAVKLAQAWWLLPQLLAGIVFPLSALQQGQMDAVKFKRLLRITVLVSVSAAVIAVLLFPWFVTSTAGTGYAPAYNLFVILLPGVLLFAINILLASKLAGAGNVRINMYASALCFAIILVLDFWLIPAHGATGAAIASSIAYAVSSIVVIIKYFTWNKNKK
jgi:O-antigen/teichoic acid export membrane protein